MNFSITNSYQSLISPISLSTIILYSKDLNSTRVYHICVDGLSDAFLNMMGKIKVQLSNWLNQNPKTMPSTSLLDDIKKETALSYGLLSTPVSLQIYPSRLQERQWQIASMNAFQQRQQQIQRDQQSRSNFSTQIHRQQLAQSERQITDNIALANRLQRPSTYGTYTITRHKASCCQTIGVIGKAFLPLLAISAGGGLTVLTVIYPIIGGSIVGALAGTYVVIKVAKCLFPSCRGNNSGSGSNHQPPPPPPSTAV